mmetsp:Transcript_5056/g.16965  ORF Transcript_5056/g.16965 Transcript_5056/m.16965 type:complete len:203 (-) Transcript_5056:209-817(-)
MIQPLSGTYGRVLGSPCRGPRSPSQSPPATCCRRWSRSRARIPRPANASLAARARPAASHTRPLSWALGPAGALAPSPERAATLNCGQSVRGHPRLWAECARVSAGCACGTSSPCGACPSSSGACPTCAWTSSWTPCAPDAASSNAHHPPHPVAPRPPLPRAARRPAGARPRSLSRTPSPWTRAWRPYPPPPPPARPLSSRP